MNELRCFIAMALGHEDTDKVYDDLIVPSLTDRKVRPIRIDRIEYNDDIDDRIIAELQECDFVIADLTYARPSVYFEAGYAQRKVPVIYISRKDHLSPKADDEFGNYRVHFDLQMKNIIPWSSPTDHNFSKRLKARVNKVIAPVLRQKKAEQQSNLESAQFATLSTNDKLKLVSDICWSEITARGYQEVIADRPIRRGGYHLDSFPICLDGIEYFPIIDINKYERSQYKFTSMIKPIRLGIKYKGTTIQSVIIHVTNSVNKRYLDNLHSMLNLPPIYNLSPPPETGRISRLDDHVFIASLKSIPKTRVMESLTSFNYDEKSNRYRWKAAQHVPDKGIPELSEIYILPYGDYDSLLARNPGNHFNKYSIKGNQIRTYEYDHAREPVGWMHWVNRYINIYIISPIQSESNLLEQMKRIVKLNKF
jgi:nucleoside 2-deoxyribosyltransferase